MNYAKELRNDMGRVALQMQGIIDKAKDEHKNGKRETPGLTAEERESWDKLANAHSDLEESIKRAERTDDITTKIKGTQTANGLQPDRESVEMLQDSFRKGKGAKDKHDQVFSKYLRHGIGALDRTEELPLMGNPVAIQNTMSTTTNTQGGYLVPQGFSGMLEEAKKWFGGIDGVVEKFVTETGNPLPWPTNNDTANKGRILGQNTQLTNTDPAFSSVTFNAYIGTSDIVLIPLALIQDSYFDLDALIARMLGTRLGRLYNERCTIGSGSSEPTGIVVAATTSANVTTFATGSTTSVSYSQLVDVEHSVDPAYRYNPSTYWMFNDTVLKILKKLVDGQSRPLWQPGLTASFANGAGLQNLVQARPTILDHPYIINQDMASPAANAYTILFGDMSKFKVREVAGGTTVMRLTERYADYLQVGYLAFQRFDSNLVDAGMKPIGIARQSAT